jgi:hypothetical protein
MGAICLRVGHMEGYRMSDNQTNQPEVNLDAIKSFIEANKDSEDVKGLLGSFAPKPELSIDSIKKYLNEVPEGQSFYDKSKAEHLDTWKKNNLDKIIQDELKNRGVVEDETQKMIRELREEIERGKKETGRANLKVKVKDLAKEKNLPFQLVDYFLGGDEEETVKNIELLETVWAETLKQAVEAKIGSAARTPHQTDKDDAGTITKEQFKKMTYPERVALKQKSPELYEKLLKG